MSSEELPARVVAGIAFVGRDGGWVKQLEGFRKGHHTVPDAANAATNAFLGKICETRIAEEAERLFQEVRAGLDYKRKEIALAVTSPLAVLGAKDFTVEIFYALEEREPARYAVTTTLRGLMSVELARTEPFARIFGGKFTEISFALRKGASVAAVIDAIEELDRDDGLTVTYPSDYRDCTITVTGVEAAVRCTGAALEIVFPRAGGPAELIEAFAAVREAFRIDRELARLIG
ncbi:MAG TPA: hypothetical protein VHE13_12585 [Opitutus sp.]|nr:hypothetical protein [Opitutus sp.]